MMNAPKRIWVDSCKDADGEPEWDTGAWGHDQQEGDEEYVRADLFAKAVEALREISSEASVPVHTTWRNGINFKKMYTSWRALAVKRIDRARAALAELEGEDHA